MAQKVKAFSYLRVSGNSQVEGDGFRRQAEAIAKFARQAGYDIVQEFREPITGTSDLDERPALSAALKAIAANGVRVVIIEHVDRLARNLRIQESLILQFQAIDARLIDAGGHDLTDETSPDDVMTRQIRGAIAQADKTRLVLKLRKARVQRRKVRGFCEGRPPYGWRQGERPTLDRMLELRRRAWSFGRIAREFNAEGLLNREGRPWSASRVEAITKRAGLILATVKKTARQAAAEARS